jgi:eukaryotic-like serine/threonine-protein kinase
MPDQHWENLKEIFHAALNLSPNERDSYLENACDGNPSLRSAVESLIKSHDETGNFVDAPVYEAAAQMLARDHELKVGELIAHYEIRSVLGEGGMGKVYLAQDSKLERKVALKILPTEFAANQEHMRRFTMEAKTAAALHHPNIAQIFEIGNQNHTPYIAMEYVAGDTLRQLLSRRKIEIKRAIEIAAQIASALSAAHQRGIIHRDIKPENLIVTTNGQIKILDFGLAKLVEKQRDAGGASELTTAFLHSSGPTETTPGVIMGTVSYMSPEQARGEKVDQRSDIFSTGVVLYEMVTGERPFKGKSVVDTLHAIINVEPPTVTELNSQVPAELTDILAKALAKDPSERYQHAGDLELDLRRLKRAIESNTLLIAPTTSVGKKRFARLSLKWLLLASLLIAATGFAGWWIGSSGSAPPRKNPLEKVALTPLTSDPGYEGEPSFSSDGETIAYVSDRTGDFEIFLKQVSGGPDINITNNKADDVQPAFSPDGKQIAFVSTRASSSNLLYPGVDFSLLGGDIWVMPTLGGSPRRIAESGNFPSWSPDGAVIIYAIGTTWFQPKIRRVAAQGGEPQDIPITFKAGEPPQPFWLYPSYSSDMRWIAFEAGGNIFVVSAEGGEARRILKGRRPAWGTNSQVIIYSNTEPGKNFSLWQVPFSSTDGATSGAPEPLTVGRGRDTQAAVSRSGKLVAYAAQDLSVNIEALPFDAETGLQIGPAQPATLGSNIIYFLSGSPDGRSIVFESHRGAASHIWRVDTGSPPVQLTSDPNFNDGAPGWSPDGQIIAFIRRRVGEAPPTASARPSLWLMSSDGANPRLLIETASSPKWLPSGAAIAYGLVSDGGQNQIHIFDLTTKSSRRLTNERGVVPICTFSPDGKWLIYQSNASGNIDLHAVPVEGGESRVVVGTSHQDYHPFVSPSGRWLYFQLDHKNVYRVPGPAQDWRQAKPEKITNFPESGLFLEDPQLSRDGRQLLYSRGRITGDIWIMSFGK